MPHSRSQQALSVSPNEATSNQKQRKVGHSACVTFLSPSSHTHPQNQFGSKVIQVAGTAREIVMNQHEQGQGSWRYRSITLHTDIVQYCHSQLHLRYCSTCWTRIDHTVQVSSMCSYIRILTMYTSLQWIFSTICTRSLVKRYVP